jgi:hypothetical protein
VRHVTNKRAESIEQSGWNFSFITA